MDNAERSQEWSSSGNIRRGLQVGCDVSCILLFCQIFSANYLSTVIDYIEELALIPFECCRNILWQRQHVKCVFDVCAFRLFKSLTLWPSSINTNCPWNVKKITVFAGWAVPSTFINPNGIWMNWIMSRLDRNSVLLHCLIWQFSLPNSTCWHPICRRSMYLPRSLCTLPYMVWGSIHSM